MKSLLEIFNENLSDKGTRAKNSHFYHIEYEKEFEEKRLLPLSILEVGIFKGISIDCWLEYFPNARIYGIDTFERIFPESIKCLSDPRVKWLKADSTDKNLQQIIKNTWGSEIKFDYIIDDGLHTPEANRKTFSILKEFMKNVYYIEDVWPLDSMSPKEFNNQWLQKHKNIYTKELFAEFLNEINLYKVERIDLRDISGVPDSYIFKIRNK